MKRKSKSIRTLLFSSLHNDRKHDNVSFVSIVCFRIQNKKKINYDIFFHNNKKFTVVFLSWVISFSNLAIFFLNSRKFKTEGLKIRAKRIQDLVKN